MPMPLPLLILGAGLAGLRAAIAALDTPHPPLVLVLASRPGPAGSSFLNRNRRLGCLVPESDQDKRLLADRIRELAAPGVIQRQLVDILVEEAAPRFHDLLTWGADRWRDETGAVRHTGACFLPDVGMGQHLVRLPRLFVRLRRRVRDMGGVFLPPGEAVALQTGSDGVRGVVVRRESGRDVVTEILPARAAILATGGPAALFPRHLAGPGASGLGLALAHRAGVALANLPFLQWMWHDSEGFFPLGTLAAPGWRVFSPGGEAFPLPEALRTLLPARDSHCPLSHGLADQAVDRWLLDHADAEGRVALRGPEGRIRRIALHAHAGNGGVWIGPHGGTSLPGLFACGEIATGMHGADRVGGAMVAATQVFGARAGRAAALGRWSPPPDIPAAPVRLGEPWTPLPPPSPLARSEAALERITGRSTAAWP